MDKPKPGGVAERELRAGLEAVAAAPKPSAGPDPSSGAIRLLAPEAKGAAIEDLLAFVDETRAGFGGVLADRAQVPGRLAALRRELAARGLDGFVVPHADEYLGEYLPLRSQRLTWLTGFDGSAGLAVVLAEAATVLVDGRYTLQVRAQVDAALFEIRHVTEQPVEDWIAERLPNGAKLGYDPWHCTERRAESWAKACARAGGELVAVETNPVDAVWEDQPPPPLSIAVPHGLDFAGEAHGDKRARIAAGLARDGAAVLAAPDSIAWLLNVRGGDVPNTPFVLSFAVLAGDGTVDWFVDGRKLGPEVRAHLGNGVRVREPAEFGTEVDALGEKSVLADPANTPEWVFRRLAAAGARIVREKDPCQLPKACKNDVELAGMRAAHVRDGAALSRFLAWLAAEAPKGGVDELGAAQRLAGFRAEGEHFRGLSFDTISGAGAHGAIVHYRATPESNARLEPGTLYLVDSGGQYLDGTTDVTRTVAIGTPDAEMRARFTLVLKGHIALARARFPEGTSGAQLDTLARAPLWAAGLDFDHGTGHGVGSYLGVHEGPQGISARAGPVWLRPGMIVSNGPGYYKAGAYGIRIENLVTVVELGTPGGGEKPVLGFETLTLAPIDRTLVDASMLDDGERAWLDAYHTRVRTAVAPLVDATARAWLEEATAPIAAAASAA